MIGGLRSRVRIVALALMVMACTSSPAPSPSPSAGEGQNVDPASFVGSSWTVRSIDGTAALADSPPTMTFAANGMVSGTGGCNEYSGPFRLDGGSISFGDVTSTLMLCEGQRGAQETAFFNALRAAQTVRVTVDGTLEIAGGGSIVAAPGIAEEPPPEPGAGLAGTSWDVV
jgi:putative lipoprotein